MSNDSEYKTIVKVIMFIHKRSTLDWTRGYSNKSTCEYRIKVTNMAVIQWFTSSTVREQTVVIQSVSGHAYIENGHRDTRRVYIKVEGLGPIFPRACYVGDLTGASGYFCFRTSRFLLCFGGIIGKKLY